jgi:hypothetical protein
MPFCGEHDMKTGTSLIYGLYIFALLFTAGICAAAEVSSGTMNTVAGETTAAGITAATQIPGDAGIPVAGQVPVQESAVPEDIPPYEGPVGPDNALYGLKIAMEDLDETFTFNESERVEKQLGHARLRIAEVRRELQLNRIGPADIALELYWQKLNQTQAALTPFVSNATGLVHAQEMITKHQTVLANLLLSHPNNTGLIRAYNNSLELEQKFEEKTQIRYERAIGKNNRSIMKAVRLETAKETRAGNGEGNSVEERVQERTTEGEKLGQEENATQVRPAITRQLSGAQQKPVVTTAPQQSSKPAESNGNTDKKISTGPTVTAGNGSASTKKTDSGSANGDNNGKGRNT